MHVDSKAPLRRGFLLGFPARGVRGGIGHAKKFLERLIYLGNSGGERPTSDVGLSSDGGTTRRSTRNSRSDAPNISLAAEQAAINVVFVDAWPWRWASGSRSGKSSHARGAQGDGNAVIRTSGRPADAPKHDGFQAGNLRVAGEGRLVIQRAEHRDTQAIHAKLEEMLLHVMGDA